MTKLEDMTSTQRQSWLILLADGAVFVWFWQKMTTGLSPVPIHTNMDEFGKIILGVIGLTIALHIIISIIFDMVSKETESGRDERDVEIERRGAFWGYRILQIGIGVIIVGMLMSGALGEDYQADIQFSTPVQVIFGMMVFSYLADLTKHAVMIHGYGR